MEKKRRKGGYFLLSMSIILCLCMASLIVLFMPNNITEATLSTSNSISIPELLVDGYEDLPSGSSSVFNSDNVTQLLEKISGVDGANIATIKELGTKDSSFFRGKNGNKDIVVTLGGFNWTVTYLTQANGSVILDLWMADGGLNSDWNSTYSASSNKEAYPSNMYGVSKVRSLDLNNGGKYWSSGTALKDGPTEAERKAHRYAKFTMPATSVKGSIIDFLLTPEEAEYQGTSIENSKFSKNKFVNGTVSNDCFNALPADEADWSTNSSINYEGKEG